MEKQKKRQSVFKHFGVGVGLAGAISTFILTSVLAIPVFNPFIFYIWVGFIPMMLYFAHGVHRDMKLYVSMFLSFIIGIGWGWISNFLALTFGAGLVNSFLDQFIVVGLILWVHLTVLGKTPFNDVSMAFFGYATTIGFYGRPDPFAGFGMMGSMSVAQITFMQIAYVVFGLVLTFLIEFIGDAINSRLLRPKLAPPPPAMDVRKDGLFERTALSELTKCDEMRNINVDWYRKTPDFYVVYGSMKDYAHDLEIICEVDMAADKLVEIEFKFNTYPEHKCLMIRDIADKMVGMPIMYNIEENIGKYLGGSSGCETIKGLLIEALSPMPFIYNINRMKTGNLTFEEFGELIPRIRKDTCIAFNFDVEDAGYSDEDFKSAREKNRFM